MSTKYLIFWKDDIIQVPAALTGWMYERPCQLDSSTEVETAVGLMPFGGMEPPEYVSPEVVGIVGSAEDQILRTLAYAEEKSYPMFLAEVGIPR